MANVNIAYNDTGKCPACGETDIRALCRRNLCLECFCYVVNHMEELTNINPVNYDQRLWELENMDVNEFRRVCQKMHEIVKANPTYFIGKITLEKMRSMSGFSSTHNPDSIKTAFFGPSKVKEFIEQSTEPFTAQNVSDYAGISRNHVYIMLRNMVNDGTLEALPRKRTNDAIQYKIKEV